MIQNVNQIRQKKIVKAKEKEIVKLKVEAESFSSKCANLAEVSKENIKLKEQLAANDTELGDASEEKAKLEEKINSLLQ